MLHIRRSDKVLGEQQIRNYLGGFDFHGDKVLEPVKIFSGGEKARLALALVAFSRPNLLLMDEPTNHLDIDMRHALTVALQSFEGALLLISHDRHLLANTVDNFLLVEDGKITIFKGDLEDYRKRVLAPKTTGGVAPGEVSTKKSATPNNQNTGKQLRQLRTRIKTLDERLARLHIKLKATDDALTDTELYQQANDSNLQNLLREKLELEGEIEQLEEEWLDHHEMLESLA